MPFAFCQPNAAWSSATSAGVRSLDASFNDCTLPVEHRADGSHTIQRSTYPAGILLIPTGYDPAAIPAVLPFLVAGGSSQGLTLDSSSLLDMGTGGGVVFV